MTIENVNYGSQRNPYNYVKVEQVSRDLATQWLTTSEITSQLNLFGDESQDEYVNSLDLATRMMIEDHLGMAIFPTQWKVYYANPGVFNSLYFLDVPEVSGSVTLNKLECYTASNTAPVTIAAVNYSYDPTGNRVLLNAIPNGINSAINNPIVLTYTQNASPIANYPVVKQAGLMMLTHLYNNRSATGAVNTATPIPYGFAALLRPYKPLVM